MAKIDTSGWKEFLVGELFDVVKGTRLTKANMIPGDIRFIGSSAMNNGCTAMVGNTKNMHTANTITVCYNGSVGETFYQDQPFLASDDVSVLYPKFDMTKEIALFIAPLIKSVSARYNYVDKWKQEEMIACAIKLPVDLSGEPDWAYMNEYMSAVMRKSGTCLENIGKVKKEFHQVNVSDWRQFSIGSLFEIEKGTRLTRAAMIDGDTPFIGATLENNGITARVGNTGHIHPGGLMTVAYNGQKATGKAFYQPIPFWASDDVNVLYPKFSLTENIALFLAPLFWEAGRPYSFGDKWGKDVMENDCLTLPADTSGDPNWTYMDEYMRAVMERAQTDLSAMQSIS